MKTSKFILPVAFFLCGSLVFNSCTTTPNNQEIKVVNSLGFDRQEVVGIEAGTIKSIEGKFISVKEKDSGKEVTTQWVDNDGDGQMDELLFQATLKANEEKNYEIIWVDAPVKYDTTVTTFSRFVPERTDDYTWENDKVAFRTYGPVAQKMVEDGVPGGTLSSGIDLWLKRVDYSIIDKWYSENLKTERYYHTDHGEGYDPYHVGGSRGCGGIGVWSDDSLIVSKNFTAYRTIATGPLRTIFELDYASWSDFEIAETKRISLDLGSNFSKFEISLSPEKEVPNYTIGITLHEKEGNAVIKKDQGIFSHWEAIDTSYVGEGVIIDPTLVTDAMDYRTESPDQSQMLIVTKGTQPVLKYYTGFAWTRSKQVTSEKEWLNMLERQSQIINNPLLVTVME